MAHLLLFFWPPGELSGCRPLPSRNSWHPALWGAGLQPIKPRVLTNPQQQDAAACSYCVGSLPYLCCRSPPHLLSTSTVPRALQFPLPYSPELQIKSHVPFSQFNHECRNLQWTDSNKPPRGGNTSNHNTLHPVNVSQSLQRLVITSQLALEHFSSFCQTEAFDLGESTPNDIWTSWFPTPPKHQISIQWDFPALLSAETYPPMQHHGSSASVLGQTTWSTEGKMR